jgi:hypothetical protein
LSQKAHSGRPRGRDDGRAGDGPHRKKAKLRPASACRRDRCGLELAPSSARELFAASAVGLILARGVLRPEAAIAAA